MDNEDDDDVIADDDSSVSVVGSDDDGSAPHGLRLFRCHYRSAGSRRSCDRCFCCCRCCCCVVIIVVVVVGFVASSDCVASMAVSGPKTMRGSVCDHGNVVVVVHVVVVALAGEL